MLAYCRPDAIGADQRHREFLLPRVAAALNHGQPLGVGGHVLELAAKPQVDVRMVVDLRRQGGLQIGAVHHPIRRAGTKAGGLAERQPGDLAARLPLGEAASLRAGAPYWVMHRADLQGALQAQVNDHPDIDLRLGCQFEDATSHAKGLTVVQRRGNARQQELAMALVGADGIWSAVRNHLFPEVQPQFSGLIAWRGTLDATTLPREYTSPVSYTHLTLPTNREV